MDVKIWGQIKIKYLNRVTFVGAQDIAQFWKGSEHSQKSGLNMGKEALWMGVEGKEVVARYIFLIFCFRYFLPSYFIQDNGNSGGCDFNEEDESKELFQTSEFVPYDASQEPLFPPELIASSKLDEQFLLFRWIER